MTMRMPAGAVVVGLLAASLVPLRAQNLNTEPTQPTMVFFSWGKPAIDSDAAGILDEVVATLGRNPTVRLRIDGHSDRSGPAAPNRRTSLQRAEAVRSYLTERGIPAAAMSTASHGEDRPIIATADGVREPQNRRVEIRFEPGPAR